MRFLLLIVLIVLLVPAIPIVLVLYLVFEVSIVAGVGVARVVLLLPGIAVDAVTFVIGFLSFEPSLFLRHAAYWKRERPGHDSRRHYCQKFLHISSMSQTVYENSNHTAVRVTVQPRVDSIPYVDPEQLHREADSDEAALLSEDRSVS